MAVEFTKSLEKSMEYLHKQGAFATVKANDVVNTMTISWGNIGFEWGRPIFTLMVRHSRYTHELLEKTNEFTISIPFSADLKEQLTICGTKSGRDIDKSEVVKFELGKTLGTPVVGNCNAYYECKVLYKQDMDLELLDEEIKKAFYGSNDVHTLYYGEIVECYTK